MTRSARNICAVLLLVLAVELVAALSGAGELASDADKTRADALYQEGETSYSAAHYPEAIASFEKALALYRTIGDRWREAASLFYLGCCYASLQDYWKAIDFHEQALAIRKELGNREDEASSLDNLGNCYLSLGDYRGAIDCHERALAIYEMIGNGMGEASCLNDLASTYQILGDWRQAYHCYWRSLTIVREIGDRRGEATCLSNLGRLGIGHYLSQALAVFREIGDPQGEAMSLVDLSYQYRFDALKPWAGPGIDPSVAARQAMAEAVEATLAALDLIPQLEQGMPYPFATPRWMLLTNLGACYEALGQWDDAQQSYKEAVQVAESVRSSLSSEEEMRSWWDRVDVIYWHLVDLMVREGQGLPAFPYVERCRARTLLDLLAKGPTNSSTGSMEAGIQSGVVDPDQIQADVEAVRASLPEDTAVLEYFVTESASYVWVVTKEGISKPAILPYGNSELADKVIACRQRLEGLDLGANRDLAELYDWLIRPVDDLFPPPAKAGDLEAPHLIIVPSGVLYYLPFQALLWTSADRSESERLVERYAVSYAPSLASLRYVYHPPSDDSAPACFLGLADPSTASPRLPEAQTEAREVAKSFACSEVYVGSEATEEAVRLRSERASFVLLSTHGMFNTTNPIFSHLILAQTEKEDGKLCTYEVFSLPLERTDLVVLSACETLLPSLEDMICQIRATHGGAADEPINLSEQQLKELTRGNELVGLTRAFIFAGSASVLSSLWSVPSASTAELMVSFYRHLEEGMGKAQALRAAQLEVMNTSGYDHPWYWAAFNLMGDWR